MILTCTVTINVDYETVEREYCMNTFREVQGVTGETEIELLSIHSINHPPPTSVRNSHYSISRQYCQHCNRSIITILPVSARVRLAQWESAAVIK